MLLGGMRRVFFAFLLFSVCLPSVQAVDDFLVRKISILGLQRISVGTVLNYLTVKEGDILTSEQVSRAVRELYKTGFFSDIKLYQEDGTLLIEVEERPAIASISISGNDEIDTETLENALKEVGISENRVFNRTLLDQMEQELRRQYVSQGKYAVQIESRITTRERNRVDVAIIIKEGIAARIKTVNIIGNEVFSDQELLNQFQLSGPGFTTVFTDSDKYAKDKLRGDLETLRSYYLDRGYIKLEIQSTQVTMSPNKESIYITIAIKEGEQYTVSDVKLLGEMVVDEKELQSLVKITPGDLFSRKVVTGDTTAINDRLGNEGYAFANVNAVPEVDETNKTVALTYFVDPGKRVYVRRINITGNEKTADEVVRREMRQLESGWFTPEKVNRSRIRIQRLSFFEQVNIETPAVPGTSDQVDVNVKVQEGSSGQLQAGVGYGRPSGIILNTNIVLNNFLGTGKRFSVEAVKDDFRKNLNLSFTDPYYTRSGISRTMSLFYRSTNAERGGFGDYSTDDKGARLSFGFPISEFNTARLGLEGKNTQLNLDESAPLVYQDWVDENGTTFNIFTLDTGWTHDNRNRRFLPDNGFTQRVSLKSSLPEGELEYYKLQHNQEWNWSLTKGYVLQFRTNMAYGNGYGDTKDLPFFERYYTGGVRSVRGFEVNSLGPKDSVSGDTVGGDAEIGANLELIFPFPFTDENNRSFRLSTFVDAGNVYLLNKTSGENVESSSQREQLRTSYGFGVLWVSPIGVFSFNWAWPINEEPDDKTRVFQWYIGAPF